MPSLSWRVERLPDGSLALSVPRAAESLGDAGRFLPEGAYTTLRSYGGTGLLLLDGHFDRLEETARLLDHAITLDRDALRRLLCEVLRGEPWGVATESRLRVTVDCTAIVGEVWLSAEPLPLPSPTAYREGVAVQTRGMHRDNPKAKNSAFLAASQEARTLIAGRVNEVLMVGEDGRVLEGLSSNFFGVRGGTLWTADEGVLPGLTRSLVLAEAERAGIPIRLEALPAADLAMLDEAFVSSTSRAVLPVVEVDGLPVGDGRPGPLTQLLGEWYAARLASEIEPVC